jgi:hypothetical protein
MNPTPTAAERTKTVYRRESDAFNFSRTPSIGRAKSSVLALGNIISRFSQDVTRPAKPIDLALLSPEELGGIEYRALRVLLKLTAGMLLNLI